jgi:hypothetical protein
LSIKQNLQHALRLFEVFAFRVYRLESKRANVGQVRFFRLGFELFRGETTPETISKEVRQTALAYSPDRSFFDRFKPLAANDFYHWSGIRYFLFEYEDHLGHEPPSVSIPTLGYRTGVMRKACCGSPL